MTVSFIGGGNRSTVENHLPVASKWRTLSHNVVSNTSRHERASNSTLVVIGTDCIGSCKSNYHKITTSTLPYLINYLESNEIPSTGAHPGFVVKGGVSMRGVWGPERVPDRTFIGNGSSGGLRNYRHLFERQFGSNHTIFIRQKKTWLWVLILSDNC